MLGGGRGSQGIRQGWGLLLGGSISPFSESTALRGGSRSVLQKCWDNEGAWKGWGSLRVRDQDTDSSEHTNPTHPKSQGPH